MKLNAAAFGAAFLCLLGQAATCQDFTIDQALSAPFASDLVRGPKTGTVAWIENQQGKRNLWVATRENAGKFLAKRLTAYEDDDGQEMYDVAWTPDGTQILYVHGGDSEFPARPDPNPTHASEGVSRDIWIIPSAGGKPRKLGEGYSPAVSPACDQVAFLS